MTTDVAYVLHELDGHPVTQLNLRVKGLELTYHQVRGWYWEVRNGGRLVTRGIRTTPLTKIEIEDLLAQVQT